MAMKILFFPQVTKWPCLGKKKKGWSLKVIFTCLFYNLVYLVIMHEAILPNKAYVC